MRLKYCSLALTLVVAGFIGCTKKTGTDIKTQSTEPKVLRLAFSDDVKSADPATASDIISGEMIGHIFDGLLSFSYLGEMGRWEAALAESVPEIKTGQKSFVFKIKKGVLFHDDPAFKDGIGREVVAQDFVYSMKRIGDPRVVSPNSWMLDGVIEGFREWKNEMEAAPANKRDEIFEKPIKGLTAVDSHTLKIDLTDTMPQFFSILSMTHTSVVAREVVEKYGTTVASHPVGTGPFKLKEWVRGSKILLEKNPKFREELYPKDGTDLAKTKGLLARAGQKIPFVDQVSWDIIKEEQPRWLKMMAGTLDETTLPKDYFSDTIGANGDIKPELAAQGFKLHKAMSLTSWWLEFNMKDPVLGKNAKLRKALAHAFDRKRALEILYNNRGVLADAPFPPSLEPMLKSQSYPYEFNIEKAKSLLKEAGFPDGKGLAPIVFDLRGPGTTPRQLGEFIMDAYEKIGVKVQIMANSFPEALEKLRTSRFQMILGGWAGDYPDPENFLQNFFSENAAPGPNSSNFNNKEYDKLYKEIRPMAPSVERSAKISKMVDILTEEAPIVYFFHSMDYKITHGRLQNYQPNLLHYGIGKFLDLETAAR